MGGEQNEEDSLAHSLHPFQELDVRVVLRCLNGTRDNLVYTRVDSQTGSGSVISSLSSLLCKVETGNSARVTVMVKTERDNGTPRPWHMVSAWKLLAEGMESSVIRKGEERIPLVLQACFSSSLPLH